MKIAILETGRPPGTLADEFGDYPAMFAKLLGSAFDVESYGVDAGVGKKLLPVVALEKKAPLVAEDLRLENENSGDIGRNDVHADRARRY